MKVEYSSNNSGGDWWLKDEHWHALEKAGWKVEWSKDCERHNYQERCLGALATSASKEVPLRGDALRRAVEEWEEITGLSSTDAGCPCCGQPHNFTLYDDNGKWIDSGPNISYSASW